VSHLCSVHQGAHAFGILLIYLHFGLLARPKALETAKNNDLCKIQAPQNIQNHQSSSIIIMIIIINQSNKQASKQTNDKKNNQSVSQSINQTNKQTNKQSSSSS